MLFKNVLVINLEKDTERFSSISRQLVNFGVDFIRIPGIDGKNCDANKYVMKVYSDKIRIGSIGCGLSHMKAWEKIVENNLDYGIVLEDDVKLTNFIKSLPDIPDDWDIVFLGHAKNEWPRNTCSVIPYPDYGYSADKGPVKISKHVVKFIHEWEAPVGTWAYVVRNKAAKWLLNNYKLQRPVDNYIIENLHKLNLYGIVPIAIKHCHGIYPSNIDSTPLDDRIVVSKYYTILNYIGYILIFFGGIFLFAKIFEIAIILFVLAIIAFTVYHYTKTYEINTFVGGDPFSVWSEYAKDKALSLLDKTVKIFDKNSIKHAIVFGTLLGWRRYGRILPWDDDMDMMISADSEEIFKKLIPEFEKYGILTTQKNEKYGFYKLYWKDGLGIFNNAHKFPFIDIFPAIEVDNISQLSSANMSMVRNVQVFRDKLEGIDVNVPHDTDKYLDIWYKNWRTICNTGNYSHRDELQKHSINVDCSMLSPVIDSL